MGRWNMGRGSFGSNNRNINKIETPTPPPLDAGRRPAPEAPEPQIETPTPPPLERGGVTRQQMIDRLPPERQARISTAARAEIRKHLSQTVETPAGDPPLARKAIGPDGWPILY